jgi:hypothetical protein
MKFNKCFLFLFIVFNLFEFNAIADESCPSPYGLCNYNGGTNNGLYCNNIPSNCYPFYSGYDSWNKNTCDPSKFVDDDLFPFIQYTCLDATAMTLNDNKQCVCQPEYYMVNGNEYTDNPSEATGCNACPANGWQCTGGTTPPYQNCYSFNYALYDSGTAYFMGEDIIDTDGCQCTGYPSSKNCTPSPDPCPAGYTVEANSGSQPLLNCSNGTYGECTNTNWECDANTITIIYNPNGGAGTVPTATQCTYDGDCNLSGAGSMVKQGHTLTQWCTEPDGTGICCLPNAVCTGFDFSVNNAEINVFAQWEPNTITITYNSNGGEGSAGPTNCTFNDVCTLSDGTGMQKAGYILAGWCLQNPCSMPYLLGSSHPELATSADDKTLYAKWTQCPAGTYYSSGNCEPCNAGYYCEGNGQRTPCPAGHTSDAIDTDNLPQSIEACYITTGTGGTKFCAGTGDLCFTLPNGVGSTDTPDKIYYNQVNP